MTAQFGRPGTSVDGPATTANRRPDIQGLRALAVLLVITFHAKLPLPGGFVGVDIFFVISGYVITRKLLREWCEHGYLRFGAFYLRRFLRLTPALAVLVCAVALMSLALQNPFGAQQSTARTGIGAMLISANYVISHAAGDYFSADAKTNPLLNTWSLSVEEQFYLFFPALLLLGLLQSRRYQWAPVLLIGVVAAGSFALSCAWSFGAPPIGSLVVYFGGPASFAFYSSIARAWEFALGALLALTCHRIPTLGRRHSTAIALLGMGMLAASALLIHDTEPFPGVIALVPVAGTLLLIGVGDSANPVSGLLSTRPMVAIGDISYSWYLWHWPLIVFAALLMPNRPAVLALAATLSILPSLASYVWVEEPLRRYWPDSSIKRGVLVIATISIPVILCAAILIGFNTGWRPARPAPEATGTTSSAPNSASIAAAKHSRTSNSDEAAEGADDIAGDEGGQLRSEHAIVAAGCVNRPLDPIACRFGPASATGTVLLAGDSQAYALGDGVIEAARRLGLDTVVTSHTGCPFLARESSGIHKRPCSKRQAEILAWALEAKPVAVVISNRSGGYVRPEKKWRTIKLADGSAALTIEDAVESYRDALTETVRRLVDAGIPVVLIGAVPEMNGFTIQNPVISEVFGARAFEISRADAEEDRRPAFEVEQALVASGDVVVYDPLPAICRFDTCSTLRNDSLLYQDETHLSKAGSLLLADGLEETLRRVMAEGPLLRP